MIRYKSIVKGAASHWVKSLRNSGTGTGGAFRPEGSYAIFMRHLMALAEIDVAFDDKVVLEFGPGSSYGMGVAALLSGARRYYAFDLVDHTTDARNLAVFDELVRLFKSRADIPVTGWCARIFPFIDDPAFPRNLLSDALLERTLRPERLAAIRHDLESRGDNFIRPRSSADLGHANLDESVDIIVSESVLEHVDDVEAAYAAFARWLSPGGAMTHLIDYSSHNLSDEWNGHWECSPFIWSLVRGKRSYLINRMPHQTHVDLLTANGMTICRTKLLRRVDGLTPDQFSPEFRGMGLRDATTALASITCRRAARASDGR
ncbi:MAG TPA: methyltransferase domain-containing protein [Xanthobacteraceae bacterium]|nr:methyltransferase domain-containing protein [Xanthobacteraceae bacterium]